ncbi:MAG: dTDP-glucose 4,6-dehydratase [Nanoarchaeota archaeon]
MKVLITGGCGFIGANFIKYLQETEPQAEIVNLDKKTYAGSGKNIEHAKLNKNKNYSFYHADICDKAKIEKIFKKEKPEIVLNFAAESHVDRSIKDPSEFVRTNVLGTQNVLDASRNNQTSLLVHISTDEVYGSLGKNSSPSVESDIPMPRSPYSASKAAAEFLVRSYFHTYNFPVIITRSSNNFGPYQFPEKLIPLFITNLIDKKKVPLMHSKENPGLNIRDWIHVEDNCRAIWHIAKNGIKGRTYNISGETEKTNMEITQILLNHFEFGKNMIEFIPHRAGHDFRYSMSSQRLKDLGFIKKHNDFWKSLKETVQWYKDNEDWWRPLKNRI